MRSFSARGRNAVDSLSGALTPVFPDLIVEPQGGSQDLAARFAFGRLNRMQIFHGAYNNPLRFRLTNARFFGHGFPVRGRSAFVHNRFEIEATPDRGPIFETGD
jgi:hypothetical protein